MAKVPLWFRPSANPTPVNVAPNPPPPTPTPAGTNPNLLRVTATASGSAAALALRLADAPGNAQVIFLVGKDDVDGSDYTNARPVVSGGKALDGVTYPGLTYDDGCGGQRPFGYYFAYVGNAPKNGINGQSVAQTQEMLALKSGGHYCLLNHSFDGHTFPYGTDRPGLVKALQLNQDYVKTTFGVTMRGTVTPSGTPGFVDATSQIPALKEVLSEGFPNNADGLEATQTGNFSWYYGGGQPLPALDTRTLLLPRFNMDGQNNNMANQATATRAQVDANLKLLRDKQASNPATKGVFGFFSHQPFGNDVATLAANLNYLKSAAAAQGLRVAFPHAQDFIEYYEVRKLAVISAPVISGSTVTWTIDLSAVPVINFSHNLTALVTGGAVTALAVEGAETSTANLSSGQLNVYKRNGFGGVSSNAGTSTNATSTNATSGPGTATTPAVTRKTNAVLPIDYRWAYQDNNVIFTTEQLWNTAATENFKPSDAVMLATPHNIVVDLPKYLNAEIVRLEMGDGPGDWAATPNAFFATRRTTGAVEKLGQFDGTGYGIVATVAPPAPVPTDKLLITGQSTYTFPQWIRVIANYDDVPAPVPAPRAAGTFGDMNGLNVFYWTNTQDDNNPQNSSQLRAEKMALLVNAGITRVRVFEDQKYRQPNPTQLAFDPSSEGLWRGDLVVKGYSDAGIKVLKVIMGIAPWQQATWPDTTLSKDHLLPVSYADRANKESPAVWWANSRVMHDDSVRYGKNPAPDASTLTPVWPNAPDYSGNGTGPQNSVKLSLGYPVEIEGGNELEDRSDIGYNAYITGKQWFAKASMEFDGHLGQYPKHGVKQGGGGTVPYVLAGKANVLYDHLRVMIAESIAQRGYLPNGQVNFPANKLNVHIYANSGGASQHTANTRAERVDMNPSGQQALKDLVYLSDTYLSGMPVIVTETGADWDVRSPIGCPGYAGLSNFQVQGILVLANMFCFQGLGIAEVYNYLVFDDPTAATGNGATRFVTSGLFDFIRSATGVVSYANRPVTNLITQASNLLKGRLFQSASVAPGGALLYRYAGATVATNPTMNGSTSAFTVNLPNGGTEYTLSYTGTVPTARTLPVGSSTLTATELPVIVVANP